MPAIIIFLFCLLGIINIIVLIVGIRQIKEQLKEKAKV
jgi:hypothetical protein